MCCIAGSINGDLRLVKKMISSMRHRGPDDENFFSKENVSLGMGRLKILDLISENLCLYSNEDLVLSYNGEVFNYLEIKKELISKGFKFQTTGDTEVLAKAWQCWGVKSLDKLNGMFAFSIYDKKNHKLYLVRDIAGEKPLYYYEYGNKFYFASETKALKNILNLNYKKNNFFDSFQHCLISTLWKDLKQIPAAHYLELDIKKNNKKLVEYWKFKKKKIYLKTVQEEFDELLKSSVKMRTKSDVPYGLYYSKGIDSSLISSYHKFKNKLYFNDKKDWKKDFFKNIKKITYFLDLPVGSLSSYPLWKLGETARKKKLKVILSGEGADEIFGGYVRYMPLYNEWILKKKFKSYSYLFNKFYKNDVTAFSLITARNENIELVKSFVKPYFEMFEDDPINAMGFFDFKTVMPSLLQMGDRMAAAHSIENRCPFLDKRIIEFGFNLPWYFKINDYEQKKILRGLLRKKSMLEPLYKEKKGLSIIYNKWLNRDDWDRSNYFNLVNKNWKKAYKIK
tara:strand:- start:197 stop:1723 length:1527 start_codon:yes stop_codon:yes gene_type:complete